MFTLVVPAHLPLLKRHLKRGTLSIKDLHRETYAISRVPAVAAAAAAPLMLVLHPHIQHQTSLTSSAESLAASLFTFVLCFCILIHQHSSCFPRPIIAVLLPQAQTAGCALAATLLR